MLSKIYAAIAAFCQKNPAVVSYVATAGAAALAHYGFKVSPSQLVAVIAVVGTILHVWLHVKTKGSK